MSEGNIRYRIRRIGTAWALIVNGRVVFEGATRGWCEDEAVRRYGLTAVQARAAARGVLHVGIVRYWGEADAALRRREGDAATPWLAPCQFETACPICRPGSVAAGARPARCVLHGGGDGAVQPTNDSLNPFETAELNAAGDEFVAQFGDRAVCGDGE